MKSKMRLWIVLFGLLGTSTARAAEPVVLGVYNSRAVAAAYLASDMRKTTMTENDRLIEENLKASDLAKKAGDSRLAGYHKGKAVGIRSTQAQQRFGTTPVHDILALIKNDLPELQKTAGVNHLVSIYDVETLTKHPDAKKIDVTLLLVAELEPGKKTLREIWEIQAAQK